jgi:hypothetical protein
MAEALHLPWVLRRAAGLARDLQVRHLEVALLTHVLNSIAACSFC